MTASILPGAEPASFAGGPTGVLVLHGFTGSPQSMRGIAERLAADGHTVELPLLPGHGTAVEDMVPTRVEHWLAAAEAVYSDLSDRTERVVVVGLSMGGTLAAALAAAHADDGTLAGAALVNPLIAPPAAEMVHAVEAMAAEGVEVMPAIGGDIAKDGVTELAYDATPIQALLSLVDRARTLQADDVGRITCPVLLLTSPQDHVVDPVSSDVLAASAAGPVERVALERSFHVATLDHDAQLIEDSISAFVARRGTT